MRLESIKEAKHILLIVPHQDAIANATALYTYILTLHKKVSLQTLSPLEKRFSFLPWYDKCRMKANSNADLVIEVESNPYRVYDYFRERGIKINKKMATSLYTSLLLYSENFKKLEGNGTTFALASELIVLEADYKEVVRNLQEREPLSAFRLRARLFAGLLLTNDAQDAKLYVSDRELKESGATPDMLLPIMKEVLNIVNVKRVTLYKSDENNKILKEID